MEVGKEGSLLDVNCTKPSAKRNIEWITDTSGTEVHTKSKYKPLNMLRRFTSTRKQDYHANVMCTVCGHTHVKIIRVSRNKSVNKSTTAPINVTSAPCSSTNSINASSCGSIDGDDTISDDVTEEDLNLCEDIEFDHRFKPPPLHRRQLNRDPLEPFKSESFRTPLKRLTTFVHKYRQRPLLHSSTTVISTSNVCPSCHHSTIRTNIPVIEKDIEHDIAEIAIEMDNMQSLQERGNPKERFIIDGRKKFNRDPKLGLKYLIDNNCLAHTEKEISQFLFNGEGLNKTVIGNYLGEKCDFNIAVLQEFVHLHEFRNQKLVPALRDFLWSFRLPGESQKIDRMMECFAIRYCEINPTIFTHHDLCYKLSFLIIMLNTLLHNPSVKEKTSIEGFISMSADIDPDNELKRDLMIDVYNSIKKEPFKIPVDDGDDIMLTFFNPDREGWLSKQGFNIELCGRYRTWKRRWFILKDKCLYYFEFTTDKEPKGIIPLENINVISVPDKNNSKFCFELQSNTKDVIKACKTDSEGKVVTGKHNVYRMSAGTLAEKVEWINAISRSINPNPLLKKTS